MTKGGYFRPLKRLVRLDSNFGENLFSGSGVMVQTFKGFIRRNTLILFGVGGNFTFRGPGTFWALPGGGKFGTHNGGGLHLGETFSGENPPGFIHFGALGGLLLDRGHHHQPPGGGGNTIINSGGPTTLQYMKPGGGQRCVHTRGGVISPHPYVGSQRVYAHAQTIF